MTELVSHSYNLNIDLLLIALKRRGTELPLSAIKFNDFVSPVPNTEPVAMMLVICTRRRTENVGSIITQIDLILLRKMNNRRKLIAGIDQTVNEDKIIQEGDRHESELTEPEAKFLFGLERFIDRKS